MTSLMATYGRLPMTVARGEGALIWDTEGKQYIDALTGIAVCALGHANPAIAEAINAQARSLVHVSNFYEIPQQQDLGNKLCEIANMDKVFFCNSGAEANEAMLKIARLHGHHRGIEMPTILVTDTAFHGRTLATLSATGNAKIQAGFAPITPGFKIIPYNDVPALSQILSEDASIVAVMLEPIQGEGGIQVPDAEYLNKVRALCDAHQCLLMLDEIQTGIGRTGAWFAHQHNGILPDVMSLAKSLGNGVPIGACLARGHAAQLMQPGSHGSTFGGNPLSCQVATTVLDEIQRLDLIHRVNELSERFMQSFHSAFHNQPGVVEIRGRGLMIGIELETDCIELMARGLEQGILLNVTAGNVVRLLPPYILSDQQADEIASKVINLVNQFLSEKHSQENA
ncbi:MAG: aspartate aminotransferase family protein [Gammaproteobacteria bacterium]|nr:aspartate aminotransferase family protein [Gammaproteobacteria bacterium]